MVFIYFLSGNITVPGVFLIPYHEDLARYLNGVDFNRLDVLVVIDKSVVLDLVDGKAVAFELFLFQEIC